MINITVTTNPSFHKKLNKSVIKKCESEAIKKVIKDAEVGCKTTCPYDTGNLSRSHASEFEDEVGYVTNSAEYAKYVINGTMRMEARNYPLEVVNKLISEKQLSETFRLELKQNGVIQ